MAQSNTIRVQKLFVVAICLKIASSGFGWWLNDPWVLGFCVPLLVMAVYVVLGLGRHESDVSDEKFADSCYYLGFIFTISSIIFSLFDLPQIGEKISLIAVRFGAAMVSTVVGLIVRVYLVSFKEDPAEALRAAEEGVVDAHARLREQLVMTMEKMEEFQSQVDVAARGTVERVNMQIENLTRSYGHKLQRLFQDLALANNATNEKTHEELRAATVRVSAFIQTYADLLERTLARIDERIPGDACAVTDGQGQTRGREELMSRRPSATLTNLAERSSTIGDRPRSAPGTLGGAVRNIRSGVGLTDGPPTKALDLPPAELPGPAAPAPSIHQLQSVITAICTALAQQQRATSKLTIAVEEALKRDAETAAQSAKLDQSLGEGAGQLRAIVQALTEMGKDVRAIGPAFDTFHRDLRGLREAIAAEVRRNRARLGH